LFSVERTENKKKRIAKIDETPFFVIPAKAGIQFFQLVAEFLDSGFHRSDDFLRNHQDCHIAFRIDSLVFKLSPLTTI
jgi:hypothetical protein